MKQELLEWKDCFQKIRNLLHHEGQKYEPEDSASINALIEKIKGWTSFRGRN